MHNDFSKMIGKASAERRSRIVLALDVSTKVRSEEDARELCRRAKMILNDVESFVAGLKINFQLLLPLGLYGYLQEILDSARNYGLPTIIDCKINDVEHTNRWAASHFFDAGFDALTANPFAGWKGGLEGLFDEARKRGKGVILLVYMSHEGAEENYGRKIILDDGSVKTYYKFFAEKAVEWRADGVIVGATRTNVVKEVRETVLDKLLIFSPGVAAQGGDIGEVFRAGADYAIVGRAVYEARRPGEAAKRFMEEANRALRERFGEVRYH
ncbi:MAG: orotidine 5'-phosphate decarboxylase [Candidatus Jordarchaeales archaeon]